jgi:acid phosphatase
LTAAALAGCGTAATTPSPSRAPGPRPHVMVIMDENDGYTLTLGSCASPSPDPYLCSIASTYASVTGWYAVQHPSNPNYIDIVSGADQGCQGDGCTGPYAARSLGGQLSAAGIPWVAYMESMPSTCFSGPQTGEYDRSHDAFMDFTDVAGASGCVGHVRPYPGAGGIAAALDGAGAPDFVWITPNLADDMDDGSIQEGDGWMRTNLDAILSSSWFAQDGTVILTMDENSVEPSGSCCGDAAGGQVPLLVLSSATRGLGHLALTGNHFGTLRSIEQAYHLTLLGAAADPANGDLSTFIG